MLRCVLFMTRPAVLKPHLERQPQQPQPRRKVSDAPPGDSRRGCLVASRGKRPRALGPWLRSPAKRSRPRPRPLGPAPDPKAPPFPGPTWMTLRLRPVMSASFCSVCASGLLSCANCACITWGARGGEAQIRGGLQGPGPIRGSSLEATPQTATVPPRHPWVREAQRPEAFSAPPTPTSRPHPATRRLPRYLQLLRGEGCPRALGRLGLTVLFRGHCPLQREAVPWGRQKWLITRPHLF